MHRAYICVYMGEFLSPFLVSQMIRQEQTFCNMRDICFGSCFFGVSFFLSLCSFAVYLFRFRSVHHCNPVFCARHLYQCNRPIKRWVERIFYGEVRARTPWIVSQYPIWKWLLKAMHFSASMCYKLASECVCVCVCVCLCWCQSFVSTISKKPPVFDFYGDAAAAAYMNFPIPYQQVLLLYFGWCLFMFWYFRCVVGLKARFMDTIQQTVIYNYPCIRSALKVCTIFRAKASHAIRLACLHVEIKTKTFHVPNTHASWIIDSFAARDSFVVHFIAFSPLCHWIGLMVRIQESSKRHVISPHIESLGSLTRNESSMQDFLNDS